MAVRKKQITNAPPIVPAPAPAPQPHTDFLVAVSNVDDGSAFRLRARELAAIMQAQLTHNGGLGRDKYAERLGDVESRTQSLEALHAQMARNEWGPLIGKAVEEQLAPWKVTAQESLERQLSHIQRQARMWLAACAFSGLLGVVAILMAIAKGCR